MYERFTDDAKKVMRKANEEAQRANTEYIGTEHILLGLLAVGANSIFQKLGISPDGIKQVLLGRLLAGPPTTLPEKLPQTPRAKKVIELAMEEARGLDQSWVGTEHILLGLIREEEGLAAEVLREFNVPLESVRHYAKQLQFQEMSPEIKAALDDLVTEFKLPPGAYLPAIRAAASVRRALQIINGAMNDCAS